MRAAAHLAVALPPALVGRLDLSTLAVVPGSFIDDELAGSASDLLYTVRLRNGRKMLVYLLFEHQSSPDPLMALRLLLYAARALERWTAENSGESAIPAVAPLVLYHGEAAWRAGLALSDLFDLDEQDRVALGGTGLELTYLLRDLSAFSDEDLQIRATDAMDLLVQLLLKHGRDEDLQEQLWRWVDVWRAVADGPGLRAVQLVLSYIGNVQGRRAPEQIHRFLVAALGSRGEEAYMTWNEQIEARGEARGEAKGQQHMFLNLLRQRFGTLSETVVARVEAANVDQLGAWTEGFFQASSPEDLLGS